MDSDLSAARLAVDDAVARLTASGARTEALARYEAPRLALRVIPRPARLRPIGRVWRLGVLLLDAAGTPYATGAVTRSTEPARRGYTARSAEDRAELRAAAYRGGFPEGETVNFAAQPIDLAEGSGPVVVRDGEVLVRWSPSRSAGLVAFTGYLRDRAELLADPPAGA